MDPEGDGFERDVKSVKGQDGKGNDEGDSTEEEDIENSKCLAKSPVPAEPRMRGSKDAQGKQQHDDVDDKDAGIRDDERCNGETCVRQSCCPGQPQHASGDTSHAEAKHRPRHEEFVALASIDLKDGHVGNGTGHVDGEEDGVDGYVHVHIGMAADSCDIRDVRRLRKHVSQRCLTKSPSMIV